MCNNYLVSIFLVMARGILVLLGLVVSQVCQAEIFTALATMKRALYIEKQLASHLRSYEIDDPVNRTAILK